MPRKQRFKPSRKPKPVVTEPPAQQQPAIERPPESTAYPDAFDLSETETGK